MEPPLLHEVPRDWRNLFVTSRVRYIELLHLPNFRMFGICLEIVDNYEITTLDEIKYKLNKHS